MSIFRFRGFLILAVVAAGTAACQRAAASASAPQAATQPAPDTQAINQRFVSQILERIGDRASEPAEQVFTNIQWLTGVPAERVLLIMNAGYSRALGVTCTHCHVEEDFASDTKRPKRAAREMAAMHRTINQQLRTMTELASPADSRAITCATCHRGTVNPMAAR